MTRRVLVIARSFEGSDGYQRLRDAGLEVVCPADGPGLSQQALAGAIDGVDGAIIGTQPFGAELFASARNLRALVKAGAGLDNVDAAAAESAGVSIAAVPGANSGAVAEYAIALMLALGRRICEVDRAVRRGEWPRMTGSDLAGATVGVIGLGNVGRRVCQLLRGFDVKLVGFDVEVDPRFTTALRLDVLSLDEIVGRSDVVTLHAPLVEETRHLIDARRLELMKQTSLIVNTARGELIDTAALYEALVDGKIGGAALDVFEEEPFRDERFLALPKVIVSSHNASFSANAIEATVTRAAETMIELLGPG